MLIYKSIDCKCDYPGCEHACIVQVYKSFRGEKIDGPDGWQFGGGYAACPDHDLNKMDYVNSHR